MFKGSWSAVMRSLSVTSGSGRDRGHRRRGEQRPEDLHAGADRGKLAASEGDCLTEGRVWLGTECDSLPERREVAVRRCHTDDGAGGVKCARQPLRVGVRARIPLAECMSPTSHRPV
jgi:hypothetical protein